MKVSGAPDVGDLIVHIYDKQRGISCPGLVVKCRGSECFITWAEKAAAAGWWRRSDLVVISESRVFHRNELEKQKVTT